MSVIEEIALERQRQINAEKFDISHDDQHDMGELANAAACYAMTPARRGWVVNGYTMESLLERMWPWSREWWRPKNRRRDLIRAGALIVAEIERLDRLSLSSAYDKDGK